MEKHPTPCRTGVPHLCWALGLVLHTGSFIQFAGQPQGEPKLTIPYREGNGGSKKLSHLLRVSQLISEESLCFQPLLSGPHSATDKGSPCSPCGRSPGNFLVPLCLLRRLTLRCPSQKPPSALNSVAPPSLPYLCPLLLRFLGWGCLFPGPSFILFYF